jgi:hypothetical protein
MYTIRVLIPRQPGAPAIALLFLLNGDGLDKGADAAKDRVDPSALILESSHNVCVTAATSLNFAAVEHSEREAAISAKESVGSICTCRGVSTYCGNSVANMKPAPHGRFGRTSLKNQISQAEKNNDNILCTDLIRMEP